jgi:pyruvate formate lyase activating enzyme
MLRALRTDELNDWAENTGSKGIAWTYNEPSIWHEFTLEGCVEAKKKGLYTVYVTNGYINEAPLREIAPHLDAANVDVKGFTDKFYKEVSGARLQPVLDACKLYRELNVHLELTYLIIPTKNDGAAELGQFCRWVVKELSPDVPVHFSRFHPDYKLSDVGPTPVKKVVEAWEIGRKAGLDFVYGGNVPHGDYENTRCPKCGSLLIERSGFFASVKGLEGGACQSCGRAIPVVF